jgi:hypothetical protein
MWILPGQDAGSRRTAPPCIIKLSQAHAIGCKTIQVRRIDLPTVATEVTVAKIVRYDEQNVGRVWKAEGGRMKDEKKGNN